MGRTPQVIAMNQDEEHANPQTGAIADLPPEAVAEAPRSLREERRILLSRETRGWIAGLSALAVAAAALAPLLLSGAGPGALNLRGVPSTDSVEDATCQDEDQSAGTGGQKVGCTFTCPNAAGSISISVSADDSDAQVSGTAECGTDSAHCNGLASCSATEGTAAGGTGTCKADSDEAFDSGLYVECTSEVTEAIDTHDPGEIGACPVQRPVPVCTNPVCLQFGTSLRAASCELAWEEIAPDVGLGRVVVGFVTGPDSAGLACTEFVCVPFVPLQVANADGGTTWMAP